MDINGSALPVRTGAKFLNRLKMVRFSLVILKKIISYFSKFYKLIVQKNVFFTTGSFSLAELHRKGCCRPSNASKVSNT